MARLSDVENQAVRDAIVPNRQGLHTRPIMKFVDLACKYRSAVFVTNITKGQEQVDGKSAIEMILLEAVQGSELRILARGDDAREAVDALAALVNDGFDDDVIGGDVVGGDAVGDDSTQSSTQ